MISAYGEGAEEHLEEKFDLRGKRNELGKKIELSCDSEELRTIWGELGEGKLRKSNKEMGRKEIVWNQLPVIQEEGGRLGGGVFGKYRTWRRPEFDARTTGFLQRNVGACWVGRG